MKHLLTLAAAGLIVLVSTQSAQAQQPASQSAPTAQAKASPKTTTAKAKPAASKYSAAQIKEAQTGLQKAGYYKGKVTGTWGPSTVKAYKAWEKANNLPESGELNDDALAKLKA